MDPLKYIFQKPLPTGNLAKWKALLSKFDIIYMTHKVVKGQALADHMAKYPVDGEDITLKSYFPDEDISFIGEDIVEAYDGLRMLFNRAANFNGVGIRVVLVLDTGQHYPVSAKLRFADTLGTRRMDHLEYKHTAILTPCIEADQEVEAASYKAITENVMEDFAREHIVCRFRVPELIITENATNLNSDVMKAMCKTFKTKHQNSTAYRP
ncbi:uncharacterized protein LOC142163890 [Nicotiana tabacum]|uniref:Uncharacterized protein LOC142163890 n=1 Tax=Nicotiana tabacum TaxID=4097 RepID=A0AC58RWN1_TOBAC